MKRLLILLCVAGLLAAIPLSHVVFAASKGAVKADMVVNTDTVIPDMPPGTVVGSVNLNTTANGCLIVVVNLDDAVVIEGIYGCRIWVNKTSARIEYIDAVDCLKVNANGQGTANCKVDLGDVPGVTIPDNATEISVNVVVRPSFTPKTTPCYVNGPKWPTEIVVPLK